MYAFSHIMSRYTSIIVKVDGVVHARGYYTRALTD